MISNRSNFSPAGGFVFPPVQDDAIADFDFIDDCLRIGNQVEEGDNLFSVQKTGGTVVNSSGATVDVADNFLRIQGDGLVVADDVITMALANLEDFDATGFTVVVEAELVSSGNEDSTLIELNRDGETPNSVLVYYDEDTNKVVTQISDGGVVQATIESTATVSEPATIQVAASFQST